MESTNSIIKSKLVKTTSIIYKSRCLLDVKSKSVLYFSLVMPYINYCSEIWGNMYRYNLWSLFSLQIIYGTKVQDHTNNLFINLNVIKFFYYIEYRTGYHNVQDEIQLTSEKLSETFSLERQMLSCYKTERLI